MAAYVYLIKALTNLHVGSGDSSYGPVDKLIQLDPVTQFPTIFGQSLKGSLREHFETRLGSSVTAIQAIFGSPVRRSAGQEPEQGDFAFTGADLLAVPRPDESPSSTTAFTLQGSAAQLNRFCQKAAAFGVEGVSTAVLQERLACTDWADETFKATARQIPVVARNYLENGLSQNLWYEQFLPHQSVFGTVIFSTGDRHWEAFHREVAGKVIQVGANATVGYGFCQFTQFTAL